MQGSYGFIVTAYKYSGNLDNVIASLLKVDYPDFHIYVVADDCKDYVYNGPKDRVTIIYPETPLKNQVRSHFMAIDSFVKPHGKLVIIDSDNLVHPDFLKNIDPYFVQGYEAVQGVRTAKNTNTVYARLDAVSELYYLFYDRKVLFSIGSSCMLSGSGMAFTTDLYRKCLGKMNTEGAGFDKVLQKRILSSGYRIAFAPNAILYDEKTANAEQLVKQRARWNNTWFRFFPFSLQLMWLGIKTFSWNKFVFGFLLFRPPLFMLIGLFMSLIVINLFINLKFAFILMGCFAVFCLGFLIAMQNLKAEKKLYMALLQAPKFIFFQVLSLFKAKRANQISVATEHVYHADIDSIREDNNGKG